MSPQDGARKIVATRVKSSVNSLFLRDEELRQGIEMLFYAYRDFIAEPDAILRRSGFGRAHHRVIYLCRCASRNYYKGNHMSWRTEISEPQRALEGQYEHNCHN